MPLCAGITHISRSPGPFSWNTVERLSRAKLSLPPSPKLNPSDLFSSLQSTPLPTAVYTSWTQLWWKTSHFFHICSSFVILCTVLDQCGLPCWSSVVSDGLPRTMFWTKRSQSRHPLANVCICCMEMTPTKMTKMTQFSLTSIQNTTHVSDQPSLKIQIKLMMHFNYSEFIS